MKKVFICLFTCFVFAGAHAQNTWTGTWSLVSVDNIYPDGTRQHPYGDRPAGMLVFDEKGNYAIQILRAVRAKIVSGDKNTATPEEYKNMVEGSNSHFGTYTVAEDSKTISFRITHAFFPNWEGTEQKRKYTFKDGVLTYVVTHTTQGGQSVIAEVSWKKIP